MAVHGIILPSRPGTKSMVQYLEDQNYRVGLSGKVHVKPKDVYPFEKVEGFDVNCVRSPTRDHSLKGIKDFMVREDDKNFCLVVALVEPHVPWVMGDASQYPPKEIILPPNIADTPITREAFSRYLAEITYMDNQGYDILKVLKETGKSEETLVLFTSEQGSQFPDVSGLTGILVLQHSSRGGLVSLKEDQKPMLSFSILMYFRLS